VRWGRSPREIVAAALDQIRDASGHVVGVALTRADRRSSALNYYGGYGYGSARAGG